MARLISSVDDDDQIKAESPRPAACSYRAARRRARRGHARESAPFAFGAAALLALGLALVSVAVHALITQKVSAACHRAGNLVRELPVIPWSEVSQIMVGRTGVPLHHVAKVPRSCRSTFDTGEPCFACR